MRFVVIKLYNPNDESELLHCMLRRRYRPVMFTLCKSRLTKHGND